MALLIDPETSGGLLAGVKADTAGAALSDLAACGCTAAVIGDVRPRADAPLLSFAASA